MRRSISLLLALFLVLSPLSSQASAQEGTYTISAQELNRLNEIFLELSSKYDSVTSELQLSKTDLAELKVQLDLSATELESWKDRFAQLESELTASKADSVALREAWQEAKSSLGKALKSFEEYKKEAEAIISKLTFQRDLAVIASIVIAILAVVGYVR